MSNLRKRIFLIIEPSSGNDKTSTIFDRFILILIALNVFAVILESFSNILNIFRTLFYFFEVFSIIIFSIEYVLRIYTSNYKYPAKNKIKSLVKYFFSPMAIIDLFAIIPFYLPLLIPIDLRFLRILRLTRILRIFKINRYTKSLILIGKVLKRKKEELVITIFITFLLMLLAASIMYYVESTSQPEAFPNIIASFWWAVATLTTVGYGDVYPITILGKVLSGIIALLGIGIVALPTGIISSGFIEELENQNESKTYKASRGRMLLSTNNYKTLKKKRKNRYITN